MFQVTALINNNVTISKNLDGSYYVDYAITNPQITTYGFYWKFTKDSSAYVRVTAQYKDADSDNFFTRMVKDFSDNSIVADFFDIDTAGNGCVLENVMRNEGTIRLHITSDDYTGTDELEVMVKDDSVKGSGKR